VPNPSKPLAGATIVFDLDGNLVDTAPDLTGTLSTLLEREGRPIVPAAELRTMIGQGARTLIARGFAAAGEPLEARRLSRLFDDFIALYLDRIALQSRPYEGALAALDDLAGAGAILAVCTNKRTDLSVALFDALGMTHRFAAVLGADAASAPKPSAAHLLETIARAGGRRDRAVMVGDSAFDAGAARAAKTPLVLVSFGYTEIPAADLGADAVIDHFDQLASACRRLLA
jgi:phosphoglycolate phosphatase